MQSHWLRERRRYIFSGSAAPGLDNRLSGILCGGSASLQWMINGSVKERRR